MAETIAAVGLAASIVTLVEFSAKINKRLDEFKSAKDNIPKSFRDIKAQLNLITNTVRRIQTQTGDESSDGATTDVVKDVIDNSVGEAEKLVIILDKALPQIPPSNFERGLLALKSLSCDKKIQKCREKLLHNVQILNLYQSANSYEEIDKVRQLLQSSSLSPTVTPNFSFGVNIGNAPQIENGAFIGREPELKQLQEYLSPQSTCSTRKTVAIAGTGGLGKTQLSLAFAKQFGNEFSSVFWLDAKDEATLKQSFAFLSQIIFDRVQSSSTVSSGDEDQIIHQVQQWFSRPENSQWLLLVDNYDDPKLPGLKSPTSYDIRRYLPFKYHGSVLITTRSRRLDFAKELPLGKLDDMEQSLAILSNRSHQNMKDDPDAVKLVKRLDGLLLALVTAGMYLRQKHESAHDYLEAYDTCWHELSDNADDLLEYEHRNLFSTWNLSLARVRAVDPEVAELPRLFAYFGAQNISYELLRPAVDRGLPWLSALLENKRRFQRAMARLRDYSLVEVSATEGYNLHTCVHDWTLQALNREVNGQYFWLAVCCVASNVRPQSDIDYWQKNILLLGHVAQVEHRRFSVILDAKNLDGDCSSALYELSYLWSTQDDFLRAEQFLKRALPGLENNLGADHVLTLEAICDLGTVYREQNNSIEAEQMYQRALKPQEEAFGPDHLCTLKTVHCFGTLYFQQGQFHDAERMYQRALEGTKKTSGSIRLLEASVLYNLGILYGKQMKFVEAEQAYQLALTKAEKALGAEHPFTSQIVYEIGLLYRQQGKMIEAELTCKRGLKGVEKVLGPHNLSTVHLTFELAVCYNDQGKVEEAEHTFQQAIAGYQNLLGLSNTDTLGAIWLLGRLYHDQNKIAEAEEMYQQAFEGYKKILQSDNPRLFGVMWDIGRLNHDQNKIAEAEDMFQQALEGCKKISELDDPRLFGVMWDIGRSCYDQDKMVEAEHTFQQALEGCKKALGLEDERTLLVARDLAGVYREQGKVVEAEQLESCYGMEQSRESSANEASANQHRSS